VVGRGEAEATVGGEFAGRRSRVSTLSMMWVRKLREDQFTLRAFHCEVCGWQLEGWCFFSPGHAHSAWDLGLPMRQVVLALCAQYGHEMGDLLPG